MIKNEYLKTLYSYNDRNLALSQLIEYMQTKDDKFIHSIVNEAPSLDYCNEDEISFLFWMSGIMQYFIQDGIMEKPAWIDDSRLNLNNSLYYNPAIV